MTVINPTFKNTTPPDLNEVLDSHKRDVMKAVNCARVGVIQSFNELLQTCEVLIAQQQVTSSMPDGTETLSPYPVLRDVPVLFMGGGVFTLTFPISVGDECLLVFNDREIDNWLINGAGLPPTTGRLHDISDAVAIVGLRSNPRALPNFSTTSVQLRTNDQTTMIDVSVDAGITVTTPVSVTINAPFTVIEGELTVNGSVIMQSTLQVDSTIIANGNITGNSISLDTHVHSGVQAGGSNTGAPV